MFNGRYVFYSETFKLQLSSINLHNFSSSLFRSLETCPSRSCFSFSLLLSLSVSFCIFLFLMVSYFSLSVSHGLLLFSFCFSRFLTFLLLFLMVSYLSLSVSLSLYFSFSLYPSLNHSN